MRKKIVFMLLTSCCILMTAGSGVTANEKGLFNEEPGSVT